MNRRNTTYTQKLAKNKLSSINKEKKGCENTFMSFYAYFSIGKILHNNFMPSSECSEQATQSERYDNANRIRFVFILKRINKMPVYAAAKEST